MFETVRTELGELLHRLKYRSDQSAAPEIIATAARFLRPHRTKFDLIIPVPASTVRAIQPVVVVANGIGAAIGVPVIACVTPTRGTAQLKNVTDPDRRKELLDGLYAVDAGYTAGKNVLLFDDLFWSGSTMNAVTDVLLRQGNVASVRALTITHTRSNQ